MDTGDCAGLRNPVTHGACADDADCCNAHAEELPYVEETNVNGLK
jgi:hypothetical protein